MQHDSNGRRFRAGMFALGILWAVMVTTGFAVLEKEASTPVTSLASLTHFPTRSVISLALDRPTLVMFLHPRCPCSRASIHELDQVLAEAQDRISVILVFTIPSGVPTGWEKGDLWTTAANLPGVRVMRDPDGVEARRFHVNGSGHALLYSARGDLLFSGGITPSRGHEGDNPGRSAIVSFVLHGNAQITRTPVFGCSLL